MKILLVELEKLLLCVKVVIIMSFNLDIKNFGKLQDAQIRIGRFTVLAGPNNTGKSFVSKLLYSLFDAMNANLPLVYFNALVDPLRDNLEELDRLGYDDEDLKMSSFINNIDYIERVIELNSTNDFKVIDDDLIRNLVISLLDGYSGLEQSVSKWIKKKRSFLPPRYVRTIEAVLSKMEENLARFPRQVKSGQYDFVKDGIKYKVNENLSQNFQISDLSDLRVEREKPSNIFIDDVGKFDLKNTSSVDFDIKPSGLLQLQDYSRVIYLESPVYWKLQLALESIGMSPRFSYTRGRRRLSGVPGYFYDLARALKEEYSGEIAFPELYEKLISKEFVGGKLAISKTGQLSFKENERNLSLHLTAMGVINLGLIALLIERKIIDRGAFIFIDEPGAHLHPSWQVKIARTLLELSLLDVNVVIATHSMNILKFLEVEVKEHPEYEDFIELNHFSHGGIIDRDDDISFNSKISKIMEELTTPFAQLYYRGL